MNRVCISPLIIALLYLPVQVWSGEDPGLEKQTSLGILRLVEVPNPDGKGALVRGYLLDPKEKVEEAQRGVRFGRWQSFAGSTVIEEYYDEFGAVVGPSQTYKDGHIIEMGFPVRDEVNVTMDFYDDNTVSVKAIRRYLKGKPDSAWTSFNRDGSVFFTKVFQDGRLTAIMPFDQGRKDEHGKVISLLLDNEMTGVVSYDLPKSYDLRISRIEESYRHGTNIKTIMWGNIDQKLEVLIETAYTDDGSLISGIDRIRGYKAFRTKSGDIKYERLAATNHTPDSPITTPVPPPTPK